MPQLISLYDIAPIATDLASGELFITPNQRLASRVTNAYAIFCHENQHPVVVAPKLKSISQWLNDCWQQLVVMAYPQAIAKQLLSSAEQLIIIERIISQSELGQHLLRPKATATHMLAAYEVLNHWLLDSHSEELKSFFDNEDAQTLAHWIDSYTTYCEQQGLLATIHQYNIVIEAFEAKVLRPEPKINSISLANPSPLQKKLINVATGHWHMVSTNSEPAKYQAVVACEHIDQEIVLAALWAKQQLKNASNKNKLPTIGIVIPTLSQQREKVARIFQEVFMPEFQRPDFQRVDLPFNFSAGVPLSDQPIIASSLAALSLPLDSILCEQLLNLLQSPFFRFTTDDDCCVARLVELIAQEKTYEISLARLRRLIEKVSVQFFAEGSSWHLLDAFIEHGNLLRSAELTKKQSLSHWCDYFKQSLLCLGWPGLRRPDSIEYQALKQWQSCLDAFVKQSTIIGNVNFSDVLNYFRQLLNSAVFQAKSIDSPIQILGVLEASGLQFDQLWLSSMSAKQWPNTPNPNPLLPIALQRHFTMPNATAERELEYAQSLTQEFLRSAKAVYVSYAKVIDDIPVSVSSLFSSLPLITTDQLLNKSLESLLPLHEIRRRHYDSKQLLPFNADKAPSLQVTESVKGGASLFANQAACPFKAFAIHRLGLNALPRPTLGLDHALRGNLIHRALELIWKQLNNSEALLALTAEQQEKLCKDYAEFALNELNHRSSLNLGPRHLAIEKDRLSHLLINWLEVEKQRGHFIVISIEERKQFRFAQLELVARVDRVDQLSDGTQLVMDYKTAPSSINSWWGDRPDQPQLPLYSFLIEQEQRQVSALCFAQVHIDEAVIKGVADENCPEAALRWNAKVQSASGALNWQQLKNTWQKTLTGLAQDFIDAKTTVDPKDSVKSCQYCDLPTVCRIKHQVLTVEQK